MISNLKQVYYAFIVSARNRYLDGKASEYL